MEIIQQFIDQMHAAGCGPQSGFNPIADDKWHRFQLASEKRGKQSGSYCLKIDGDFGVGCFQSFKEGINHKFVSSTPKEYTAEEKREWAIKIKREKAEQERLQAERWAQVAKECKEQFKGLSAAKSDHPYLVRKGVKLEKSAGIRADGDLLAVPQYIGSGISGIQTINADGAKMFKAGSQLKGAYFPIASAGDDKTKHYITEGLATGLSIREAVGEFPVWVAFNASNLPVVAEFVRNKYPDAVIIICADNDQWSTNSKDEPYNAGTHYGQQAAVRVKGFMVYPQVPDDDESKRTDFNDLHVSEGIETVRAQVSVAKVAEKPQVVAESNDPQPVQDQPPLEAYDDIDEPELGTQIGNMYLPFNVLGYNDDKIYYYSFGMRQITGLTASSHTINNMLMLASLDEWKLALGGEDGCKPSDIPIRGLNVLRQIAQRKGMFIPDERVRGTGAWMDNGRTILHCGDIMYVDNIETPMERMDSKFVYTAGSNLIRPSDHPLNNSQANKLYEICTMPTWENELSGALLAGWIVTAPICSLLSWRPHIWVTGEAGSGKSTVMDMIIKPAVGDIAFSLDSKSTEAALRQQLGYSGRPVIFDEAEPSVAMDGVIELARLASSGGVVKKFGQNPFKAQFQACFSSINPPIKNYADRSRISLLVLKKNRSKDAEDHYNNLLDTIEDTISPEWQQGLLARTLDNIDALLANVKTFRSAARVELKAGREADQIAPLLAGLYMLFTTEKVSLEKAQAWISEKDWTLHTSIEETSDPEKLLQHISTSIVKDRANREIMIGELIRQWSTSGVLDEGSKVSAYETLIRYGIKPDGEWLYIANNSQNLAKLLKDTDWQYGWTRTLSDLKDSIKSGVIYFAPNNKQRSTKIPLSRFVEGMDND